VKQANTDKENQFMAAAATAAAAAVNPQAEEEPMAVDFVNIFFCFYGVIYAVILTVPLQGQYMLFLCHVQCFDTWLGERKGIWFVRGLCQLFPKAEKEIQVQLYNGVLSVSIFHIVD